MMREKLFRAKICLSKFKGWNVDMHLKLIWRRLKTNPGLLHMEYNKLLSTLTGETKCSNQKLIYIQLSIVCIVK